MTIASEIQRIKNNIANAYTAILEKGGVLPSNKYPKLTLIFPS